MKWIEVVQLRAADNHLKIMESRLKQLIDVIGAKSRQQNVMICRRSSIITDYSIHILHDSSKVEGQGSHLGLQLATALKEFGLVNHSIWVEISH
jgi:hypothetical protein